MTTGSHRKFGASHRLQGSATVSKINRGISVIVLHRSWRLARFVAQRFVHEDQEGQGESRLSLTSAVTGEESVARHRQGRHWCRRSDLGAQRPEPGTWNPFEIKRIIHPIPHMVRKQVAEILDCSVHSLARKRRLIYDTRTETYRTLGEYRGRFDSTSRWRDAGPRKTRE